MTTTALRPAAHRRALVTTGLLLGLVGGLTACGGTESAVKPPPAPRVSNTATTPTAAAPPLPPAKPTGLKIASAGVDAKRMVDLSVDGDTGELGVPDADKDADVPGWWTQGVTPGEKGVSVLVAHFDTRHGPALMKNVKDIKLGDVIEVPREDGRTAKFTIREIQDVNKKDFPTEKVYGATDRPELRVLTCGGEIENGHRANNVILYADLHTT
ncbi:sortase domain-bontaining protein [Streptomyces sp. BI20]|uniref:sortase domain-containing protein n=1 Tax=Streptomyces sp. BI20 TaxID=3403460 RepID=UPI003C714690